MATTFAPASTLERAIKGKRLAEHPGTVVHMGGVRYRVLSSNGQTWYIVNLAEQTCTCADNRCRGALCKHLHAARQAAQPARIRARVDVQGAVTGWHYANAEDDAKRQAETERQAKIARAKQITDELFPL